MFFPLINLHTIPHNDLNYIYTSIQTLYSVLCWSTFGSDYSLESFGVWRFKLGTSVFGEFLPLFSADSLRLCQVGWRASVQSYFQVSPEMFIRVQVRALSGSLKDIQRLVPKTLLRCLGCVLRVIVLLESEPSPQSEVLSSVDQVLYQVSLYTLLHSYFPSILTSLSVPAAEKHPYSLMLPPPYFTIGMVPGFLQTFRPKFLSWGASDQRILLLMVWESFRCLLANSKRAVMCLSLRRGFLLATLP